VASIVSLLPSGTEWIYALGLENSLAGVTFECDHPADARGRHGVVVHGLPTDGLAPGEIDALYAPESRPASRCTRSTPTPWPGSRRTSS
jgi:iron complex transport system substrate-binding protein